jgi:hypothetical protein
MQFRVRMMHVLRCLPGIRNELVKQTLSLSFCSTSASAIRTLLMTGLRNAPEAFEKRCGGEYYFLEGVPGSDRQCMELIMKLRDECIESPTIFRCSPICPTSTSEKTRRHTALGLFLAASLPASLTVSTPCAQATLGSLLLQPLLIPFCTSPSSLCSSYLATSSVPERDMRMRRGCRRGG